MLGVLFSLAGVAYDARAEVEARNDILFGRYVGNSATQASKRVMRKMVRTLSVLVTLGVLAGITSLVLRWFFPPLYVSMFASWSVDWGAVLKILGMVVFVDFIALVVFIVGLNTKTWRMEQGIKIIWLDLLVGVGLGLVRYFAPSGFLSLWAGYLSLLSWIWLGVKIIFWIALIGGIVVGLVFLARLAYKNKEDLKKLSAELQKILKRYQVQVKKVWDKIPFAEILSSLKELCLVFLGALRRGLGIERFLQWQRRTTHHSKDISVVKGIYLPEEEAQEGINASWKEFLDSENLSNPQHPFSAHILACFEAFKQKVAQEEAIKIGEIGFYLPKEQAIVFIYGAHTMLKMLHSVGPDKMEVMDSLDIQDEKAKQILMDWFGSADALYSTHRACFQFLDKSPKDFSFWTTWMEDMFARGETYMKKIYPKLPTIQNTQGEMRKNTLSLFLDIENAFYMQNGSLQSQRSNFADKNTHWFLMSMPFDKPLKETFSLLCRIASVKAQPKKYLETKQIRELIIQMEVGQTSKVEEIVSYICQSQEAESRLEQGGNQIEGLENLSSTPLNAFIWVKDKWVSKENIGGGDYARNFLEADSIRADITPYDPRILSDANRGSWELWDVASAYVGGKASFMHFETPLIARNPKADIKEGLVGIDFGTTSTVVVYQEGNSAIRPMRVGLGDFATGVERHQYENPTILSFTNLTNFLQSYKAQAGRPKTEWEEVQVSHTAYSTFLGSPSSEYNAYLSELKAWAGNQHEKLQILDKQKAHFEVKGALDLRGDDLNPIELYAYYLGLYINNQHHGIFLNYLLSFPVTYEPEVRTMILESFKRGIAKSLPNSLHSQGVVAQLKVEEGAGEPAAYALIALEGYGFDPSENERVYYGVFDFGGGTTDFDFGLFKGTPDSSRYDYVLEHFGAGGDRYLGGENLLELASFEVFKHNKNLLLEKQIPFKKAAEGQVFLGSETLINHSQEARTNTKTLVEKLRPLWEGGEFEDEGELRLNLFDRNGQQIAGVSLDFRVQEVQKLFKERIRKGVERFFERFYEASASYFKNKGDSAADIDTFHIFLAGNASKSAFVQELFNAEIARIQVEFQESANFILHQPLASTDLEKPNGKTGVAFGLIKARRGGSIQVINTYAQESTRFKYSLGRVRRQRFEMVIDRNRSYDEWVKFIDASESHFEVYYTAQESTHTLSLTDPTIKKKTLETGINNPDAFIFIRLVSPNAFEFVVATQEGITNETYLKRPKRIEL
ncbi:hypothetical protein [Helicobacter salomonis]|uniref:hypothetical protein n=1 Tax=Helicobacter salomonis TaxID=56878 RepID=UPI0018F86425|nr:hypothetical protein [Helicobacter salomonis]